MRLRRLDLTRYGTFTDRRIDFGEVAQGQPDLHVIYGPNEAGKTTAQSAFLDLLFGIERKTRYNFLHPYASMQIGAALEIDGCVHELVRIKKDRSSLLGPDGEAVSEGFLKAALAGVDRDAYRAMYSLDEEILEAGGESILASRGDVGQLLFSATAGLSGLGSQLAQLREQADAFFKPRAQGSELARYKAELTRLEEERKQLDVKASSYAKLVQERDRAQQLFDAALAERKEAELRREHVERLLAGLPLRAKLEALEAEVSGLAALRQAPPEWDAALAELRREGPVLQSKRDEVARQLAEYDAELERLQADAGLLQRAEAIDGLEELRDRFNGARRDLPRRQQELRGIQGGLDQLLKQLGREPGEDAAELLLDAATAGRIRALSSELSGVQGALGRAEDEELKARRKLDAARRELPEEALGLERRRGIEQLLLVSEQLRKLDLAAEHGRLQDERRRRLTQLEVAMAGLAPWRGEPSALLGLSVPQAEHFQRFRQRRTELERGDRKEALAECASRCERLRARIAALTQTSGVVDEATAAESRAARERAWVAHRSALDGESADAFERALRSDDRLADARLLRAKEWAELGEAARQLAEAEVEREALREAQQLTETGHQALEAELRAALEATAAPGATGLPLTLPLSDFEAWTRRRVEALECGERLRGIERELEGLGDARAHAEQRLRSALGESGVEADVGAGLEALLDRARVELDAAEGQTSARKRVRELAAELEERSQDVERARQRQAKWRRDWEAVLAGSWIGASGVTPEPAVVNSMLELLQQLEVQLQDQRKTRRQVEAMEQDRQGFVAEVAALSCALGRDFVEAQAAELDSALRAELVEARRDETERARIADKRAQALERARELDEALAVQQRRGQQMLTHFGVEDLTAVAERLEQLARRRELERAVAEVQAALLEGLACDTLEQSHSMLEGLDRQALEAERKELSPRVELLDQRTRELFAAREQAAQALDAVGGDDAVLRIEGQRRTLLLSLEQGALGYLRLRLGVEAAQAALALYREQHRSSMMEHASECFRRITAGAYQGLRSRAERGSEVLIGVTGSGRTRLSTEMSKGTRFQLYLALRVAGHRELSAHTEPAVFICDDIMETFDDQRAARAFELLGEMAGRGQVIYLTHHRHLCDIAREACPGATVHEISR
ncbi:MAG: AAA family ATPase [Myxococcales bacterium]|nr:AAA family ATPase [Myxococcales bacterium]